MMRRYSHENERGFVLATSLVMMSLLTLMAVAMFFTGRASTQVSSSAQHSTEGYYYAETAVNYVIWAMRNDVEFDGYDYRGSPVNDSSAVDPAIFPALATPASSAVDGDWSELMADLTDPGPTAISDTSASGMRGQILYLDNTMIADRESRSGSGAIVWPLPVSGGDPVYPTLYRISTRLPRYIRLDIDESGVVTPSIPALPHANPPVVGEDIPDNGAVVWLTTGNSDWDFEVDPTLAMCAGTPPTGALACGKSSKGTAEWLLATGTNADGTDQYGVVVYAIGYVSGRPSSIIRTQIK